MQQQAPNTTSPGPTVFTDPGLATCRPPGLQDSHFLSTVPTPPKPTASILPWLLPGHRGPSSLARPGSLSSSFTSQPPLLPGQSLHSLYAQQPSPSSLHPLLLSGHSPPSAPLPSSHPGSHLTAFGHGKATSQEKDDIPGHCLLGLLPAQQGLCLRVGS